MRPDRNADQPVLSIPTVGPLTVRQKVTDGVPRQGRPERSVSWLRLLQAGVLRAGLVEQAAAASLVSVIAVIRFLLGWLCSRRSNIGRPRARHCGSARKLAVAGIGQIAPVRRQRAACKLTRGDLVPSGEIGERERAEVAGMTCQPAERVIAEVSCSGSLTVREPRRPSSSYA